MLDSWRGTIGNMQRLLLAFVLLLAACGGGTTAPTTTTDAVQEVQECVSRWDAYVDEWNVLTAQRDAQGATDVVVDGVTFPDWESYAKAKGYPLTYEELCQ